MANLSCGVGNRRPPKAWNGLTAHSTRRLFDQKINVSHAVTSVQCKQKFILSTTLINYLIGISGRNPYCDMQLQYNYTLKIKILRKYKLYFFAENK